MTVEQRAPIDEAGLDRLANIKSQVLSAGYNIHQLTYEHPYGEKNPYVVRSGSELVTVSLSDAFRQGLEINPQAVDKFVVDHRININGLKQRGLELSNLRNNSGDDVIPIANSLIVLSTSRQGADLFTLIGNLSAEFAGKWRGGRSNHRDSLVLELSKDIGIAETLLSTLDITARGYSDGTQQNYHVLANVIRWIFPAPIQAVVESHMFRRQEVSQVIDFRK